MDNDNNLGKIPRSSYESLGKLMESGSVSDTPSESSKDFGKSTSKFSNSSLEELRNKQSLLERVVAEKNSQKMRTKG